MNHLWLGRFVLWRRRPNSHRLLLSPEDARRLLHKFKLRFRAGSGPRSAAPQVLLREIDGLRLRDGEAVGLLIEERSLLLRRYGHARFEIPTQLEVLSSGNLQEKPHS